jgi:hypothetical protein
VPKMQPARKSTRERKPSARGKEAIEYTQAVKGALKPPKPKPPARKGKHAPVFQSNLVFGFNDI